MTVNICSVQACSSTTHAKGMCNPHYLKNKRWGDPLYEKPLKNTVCTATNCQNKAVSQKLCSRHYARLRRVGDPNDSRGDVCVGSVAERFWYRVSKGGDYDCWEWLGSKTSKGYGQMSVNNKPKRSYRVSYEIHFRELGRGEIVDHICQNKGCVNPNHLRVVTNKQNLENRGNAANNTSGYRGVVWDKCRNKWIAQASHLGKNYRNGAYDSKQEANVAAIELRNRLFTHNENDK